MVSPRRPDCMVGSNSSSFTIVLFEYIVTTGCIAGAARCVWDIPRVGPRKAHEHW